MPKRKRKKQVHKTKPLELAETVGYLLELHKVEAFLLHKLHKIAETQDKRKTKFFSKKLANLTREE